MKFACIFPGQGAQRVGMCLDLYKNLQVARDVFDEADEVLKQKLSKIIFEGTKEELMLTKNTQVALMVCSIALLKVLEHRSCKKLQDFCIYVAGHSLGEFTALVASGVITFGECVKLLRLRGVAMQEAVPVGQGAMFALLGANVEVAMQIAQEAGVYIANDNAPSQQVLSGQIQAINNAVQLSKNKGYKTIMLNVSGPFHSPLMEPAKEKLAVALESVEFNDMQIPIISNFSADIVKFTDLKSNLLLQLTNTVKWCDSIRKLVSLTINNMLELGPGEIYTNLTRRIDPQVSAMALNDESSIDVFVEQMIAREI